VQKPCVFRVFSCIFAHFGRLGWIPESSWRGDLI